MKDKLKKIMPIIALIILFIAAVYIKNQFKSEKAVKKIERTIKKIEQS